VMPALRAAPVDPRDVLAALDAIPDPEIPAVSIVELGMIGGIDLDHARIRVELLPTFVGCPALEVIRDAISTELGRFGLDVDVEVSFATPWTSDRISPAGREKLRQSGFAPPPHLGSGRGRPQRRARRALPVLRLAGHHARERVRADAMSLDPALRRVPSAVRGVQADLAAPSISIPRSVNLPGAAWRARFERPGAPSR
jgi:phenylacetate-CoA oxygenase PaaJ subunit